MKKRLFTTSLLIATLVGNSFAQTAMERLEETRLSAVEFLDTCTRKEYPIGLLNNLDDAIYSIEVEREAGTLEKMAVVVRSRIRTALSNAQKAYGKHFDMETSVYDTNRGFRHPGGLHTQADFDRIKAQLEAKNPTVVKAHNVLKTAAYAQPNVSTSPTEQIIRGGGVGENYINAARGATAAYQNALRWKIEDNKACADAAVRILMAWANTTKSIGGDSNFALASGLYGYQFAQAAELMRDYEGWKKEDFNTFCQWMLNVWYKPAISFMRGRCGTWENSGKWWQAPGHYWSNWGLCNALCLLSIGVLCDDVFIYNQGLSYMKYDQVGTFKETRTEVPIKNDGLTEFLGNLVVTTTDSDLETGAYGKLGQMNESGRDSGHPAMALGLAVDIAHQIWNQGDDFFAYMDHRLAAGIEYIAAQVLNIEGLPWTDYIYGSSGYYYTDSRAWTMTEPCKDVHVRPCWGTVIGHYEGVKGVKMPFSEKVLEKQGIDGGGAGSTSGGYDQLGYSVLMNTRDVQLCPADQVPTELQGYIELEGTILKQNELGGLVNTYTRNNLTSATSKGKAVTLMPQLPEGEEDTGLWEWTTGETTRNIQVTTDRSQIYRVTYTNKNGIKSEQAFNIATLGDCNPADGFSTKIELDGVTIGSTEARVERGSKVTFSISGIEYCSWQWEDCSNGETYTTNNIYRDRDFYVVLINQGGARSLRKISIRVKDKEENITGLLLHHDFEKINVDEDGEITELLDVREKYPATLSGSAVRRFLDDNNYAIFTGNNKGYVDLGSIIGADIFSQLKTNYTISLDICVTTPNQLSNFCWAWAISNGTGQYSALVNKAGNANWYYEIKDGTAYQTNSNSSLKVNEWHTITVVQKGTTNTLYIDGVQKGTSTISLKPTTFGYQLVGNWLGRSPFSGDAYMTNTYFDNFRVYNTALSEADITSLAEQRPTSKKIGDETGIESIMQEPNTDDTNLYDLQGRKVNTDNPTKGIYIKGGKKIFMK